MRTYILMNFKTVYNLCRNHCPSAIIMENANFDGDWPERYFPGHNSDYIEAASIWEPDSVVVDGVAVFWDYSLIYAGGMFRVFKTPEVTNDIVEKVKAHIRRTHDVVSLHVVTIKGCHHI